MEELNFWAKWDLTDFDNESKKAFYDAVKSGEDFIADYECLKEAHSAFVYRDVNGVHVTVTVFMDDLEESDDLIYDALYECGLDDEEHEIPDNFFDYVREEIGFYDISDRVVNWEILPQSASFNDICAAINRCETSAEEECDTMFIRLCNIVKQCYSDFNPEN